MRRSPPSPVSGASNRTRTGAPRVAEVLEHEKEQATLELDIQEDVGLHVLGDGVRHDTSFRLGLRSRKCSSC